jgi:pimeloyl-ACP methyl ester carboxylesterase
MQNPEVAYGAEVLPEGVRSNFVENGNGLRMHVLEAGRGRANRPAILLLHGFPELAFSWRKVMLPLAAAGYHVIAPDQRGYGRTTGWDDRYDGDVASFGYLNLVRDATGLLTALGIESVAAVVGHDFGSPVAGWCALTQPDRYRSVVLMSAPFAGAPVPRTAIGTPTPASRNDVHAALAALPRPRKHYMWHYATRAANASMLRAPQGLHDFLRAYYHVKSADWPDNAPVALTGWTAEELAKLPTYYVMDLDCDMPATVAPAMPTRAMIGACGWLSDPELAVYVAEYARTGFQGGLNWYRCAIDPAINAALGDYAGRTIDVPACFIGGRQDWGIEQTPGALRRMATHACTRYRGTHLIDRAGHWVQQEQPERTVELLIDYLSATRD